MNANRQAFLTMIAWSEGTERALDPYRVCYGFKHTIVDLALHPAEWRPDGTQEWRGERLDDLGPAYVGKWSTAAGRYQINRPWWERAKTACQLTNFFPPSQDAAALWFMDCALALHAVDEGHIGAAILRCRATWASLPGGQSGQPEHTVASLAAVFQGAGGTLAA